MASEVMGASYSLNNSTEKTEKEFSVLIRAMPMCDNEGVKSERERERKL